MTIRSTDLHLMALEFSMIFCPQPSLHLGYNVLVALVGLMKGTKAELILSRTTFSAPSQNQPDTRLDTQSPTQLSGVIE